MATFIWTLQGTSPTTIDLTDIIQFAGASFGNAIFVGAYNDSTHIKTAAGANKSLANTPHNTKYIGSDLYQLDGGSTLDMAVTPITTAQCPLKINFAHGVSVAITNHIFFAYDGADTALPPTGVTFKAAEFGDLIWTGAGGSASAVSVGDSASATSHDFFFMISASPDSVGLKTAFKIRDELIYS